MHISEFLLKLTAGFRFANYFYYVRAYIQHKILDAPNLKRSVLLYISSPFLKDGFLSVYSIKIYDRRYKLIFLSIKFTRILSSWNLRQTFFYEGNKIEINQWVFTVSRESLFKWNLEWDWIFSKAFKQWRKIKHGRLIVVPENEQTRRCSPV